jgi:hypothetical protein
MKYKDFLKSLTALLDSTIFTIKPAICLKLGPVISIFSEIDQSDVQPKWSGLYEKNARAFQKTRFIVFPVKIYGESGCDVGRGSHILTRHLNVLVLDNKTKIVERFEPTYSLLNHRIHLKIDTVLEKYAYEQMRLNRIYFLKYVSRVENHHNEFDKDCGFICIKYLRQLRATSRRDESRNSDQFRGEMSS